MYRVGFPGWKLAARLGVTLVLRVEVAQDKEAGVLIATSPDLKGLVVEAKTTQELMQELPNCADMLLAEYLQQTPKNRPNLAWNGTFVPV